MRNLIYLPGIFFVSLFYISTLMLLFMLEHSSSIIGIVKILIFSTLFWTGVYFGFFTKISQKVSIGLMLSGIGVYAILSGLHLLF